MAQGEPRCVHDDLDPDFVKRRGENEKGRERKEEG